MSLAGAFRKITKGVKKAVKGVGKAVKGVYKGTKKLLKNKYVRMGLLIAAACTLPPLLGAAGLGATAGLGLSAVSAGAITGAVVGAGGGILAGEKPKEWLAKGAFGAATGAAFAKIGESIKAAQAAKAKESLNLTQGNLDAATADLANVSPTATPTGEFDVSTIGDVQFPESGNLNLESAGSLDVASTDVKALSDIIKPKGALDVPRDLVGLPSDPNLDVASVTATSTTEPTALDTFKEGAKEFGIEAGKDLAMGALNTVVQQRLMGDPANIGAYGMGLGEEAGTNLLPFQIAYQEADINIADAYANLTYGSGDISNYINRETPLFKQETLQVS